MTSSEPLAGLDDIAWSGLEHAYGEAADVPALLRTLLSDDVHERQKTIYQLYGNIFHQGTRYQATAYAVPFLARLALEPSTFRRAEIVDLLGAITVGYDEVYLPAGIDPAAQRADFARLRTGREDRLREYDEWVAAATDEGDRQRRQWRRDLYDYELEVRAADDHLAAYGAVRAQIPALRTLLAEHDPALRASVAYLLAWFPEEEAAESLEKLTELLSHEADPRVKATAIVTLGLIGTPTLAAGIRDRLTDADPLVRWAAAVALARLGENDAAVVAALAEATANPPDAGEEDGPSVRFLDGDLRGYASQSLIPLADALTDEAFDAVLAGLAGSREIAAFSIASAALRLAFPEGPAPVTPPFAELGERQRRVVRALAELGPETWKWANFAEIVAAWRLPRRHGELREYAGLAPLE
jgi:hypothetical protein